MATVNNWLAFSLSQQDLPPSQTDSTLISAAATDEVSGDVCFNIPQGCISLDRYEPDTVHIYSQTILRVCTHY